MKYLGSIALALALSLGATPGGAAEKMTLILDWFVNPDHAPLIVAQQRGYFADAGLDVKIIAPADPNNPPKLVAAGKAEVAVSYQPQLHVQVAQGLPLIRIGTLVATPLNALVVLASGPIKSLLISATYGDFCRLFSKGQANGLADPTGAASYYDNAILKSIVVLVQHFFPLYLPLNSSA